MGGLSGHELWLFFVGEVEFNVGARGQSVGGELCIPCVAAARLRCSGVVIVDLSDLSKDKSDMRS